jgi:hypothetical protein
MTDHREPTAKVPFLVAEIRRQQAALDAQAVARLLASTLPQPEEGNEPTP